MFLSMARKEVLIKVIDQENSCYCLSTFLLSKFMCEKLQKMMNSFWWGTNKDGRRGFHWQTWEKLCYRKEDEGMSFRHLHSFNLELLGKHGWNLLTNPNSLVTRLLKAKFYHHDSFLYG